MEKGERKLEMGSGESGLRFPVPVAEKPIAIQWEISIFYFLPILNQKRKYCNYETLFLFVHVVCSFKL